MSELIQRIVEVTGASETVAEHLLEIGGGNVETAISLFFDQNLDAVVVPPANEIPASMSPGSIPPVMYSGDDDDNVRAPIPRRHEQLVGPEDDNFVTPAMMARAQRMRICPFRDFAREGALMEEQLQFNSAMPLNMHMPDLLFGDAAISSTAADNRDVPAEKSSRLGDLFRPPTELIFPGSFQQARDRALQLKVALLVNVQSDNFHSHALNRDVWNSTDMRKLVKSEFILWQVHSETPEGRRFVTFYHCGVLPYVCVVDPLTGEELWHSAEPNEATLYTDLKQFIRRRRKDQREIDDDAPSTSKKCAAKRNGQPLDCTTSNNERKKRFKVTDMTEEEQLAMAIRNSMRENCSGDEDGGNDDDAGDEDAGTNDCFADFDDDSTPSLQLIEEIIPIWEDSLGSNTEMTALKLRLTDAEGADKTDQLRWPSDTKVKVLSYYIGQNFKHIPINGFKLICAFPRLTIDPVTNEMTLKEVGLHPSANLHISLDDDV